MSSRKCNMKSADLKEYFRRLVERRRVRPSFYDILIEAKVHWSDEGFNDKELRKAYDECKKEYARREAEKMSELEFKSLFEGLYQDKGYCPSFREVLDEADIEGSEFDDSRLKRFYAECAKPVMQGEDDSMEANSQLLKVFEEDGLISSNQKDNFELEAKRAHEKYEKKRQTIQRYEFNVQKRDFSAVEEVKGDIEKEKGDEEEYDPSEDRAEEEVNQRKRKLSEREQGILDRVKKMRRELDSIIDDLEGGRFTTQKEKTVSNENRNKRSSRTEKDEGSVDDFLKYVQEDWRRVPGAGKKGDVSTAHFYECYVQFGKGRNIDVLTKRDFGIAMAARSVFVDKGKDKGKGKSSDNSKKQIQMRGTMKIAKDRDSRGIFYFVQSVAKQ